MKNIVDARGLTCPKPVLKCKDFIENHQDVNEFLVIVDNEISKENVLRFLNSMGFEGKVKCKEGKFEIYTKKIAGKAEKSKKFEVVCEAQSSPTVKEQVVIFITTDSIGHADERLGKKLMKNFLSTLPEIGESLWRIILLNGGVKLAIGESFVIDELKKLEGLGVKILVCGTCLEYFGLLDKKEVGETTNMLDVVTSLQLASKVIKI